MRNPGWEIVVAVVLSAMFVVVGGIAVVLLTAQLVNHLLSCWDKLTAFLERRKS